MKDKKLKPCKLCMKNPEYNGDYWHCSDKGCPLFETLMKEDEWNNLMNTHPESPQKVHSCKCRTGQEGAMTVKRIDDGLYKCPRCGGIIVPKPDPRFVGEKGRE